MKSRHADPISDRRVSLAIVDDPPFHLLLGRQTTPIEIEELNDISSPHWSSEALVPIFQPRVRTAKSFVHAKWKKERSLLGARFLKEKQEALLRTADSVIGISAVVRRVPWSKLSSSGTAFEVGPGVYLTYNHFPGPIVGKEFYGVLPATSNGKPVVLKSWMTDTLREHHGLEAIPLDPISNAVYKKKTTPYQVMLKTLQQARFEGIWQPCTAYAYRWGNKIYITDRASQDDLGLVIDVGVFNISPQNTFRFTRGRLFPSENVREISDGTLFATLGFPRNNPDYPDAIKPQEEFEMPLYMSGGTGELRACVGAARFAGIGSLFGEPRIEMIGVQNVIGRGSSGGPLISIDDDHGRFMGISVSAEKHDDKLRGSTYITVDNPTVIATYLHFVLPRYDIGICTQEYAFINMEEYMPPEIISYLSQNKQFCQWYVEVAWQRLSEDQKSSQLARLWSNFGNLANPQYHRVPVPDNYDDWLGIGQICLLPRHIKGQISTLTKFIKTLDGKEMFYWLESIPSRLRLINQRW